jgi:hypothetical protein
MSYYWFYYFIIFSICFYFDITFDVLEPDPVKLRVPVGASSHMWDFFNVHLNSADDLCCIWFKYPA